MAGPKETRRLVADMIEVDVLDLIEQALDHSLMVEHLPSRADLVQLRMRLGTTRHEKRTAIRRRLAGDVIGPDLLRANDDLLLIGPDERAKDGQVDDFVDRHDVLKRLRSDLAEGFPRHDRLRALHAGDALGDGVHHPSIHDDPQLAGAGKGDLPLAVAEGDHIEPADLHGRRERAHDVLREVLARIGGLGTSREVDRNRNGATASKHPGRDRGIYAARKQGDNLAGAALR